MSIESQTFLEKGGLVNDDGSIAKIELIDFPTEKDADEALWLNPEEAARPLRLLLKQNGGELTPLVSRLALKSLAVPLFIREAEGPDASQDIQEVVNGTALRTSFLLDAYLDLLDDESVDQTILNQAINDAVVFQLVARSFRSAEKDNVVLLPVSPEEFTQSPKMNFTVLRRRELGRAHLIVSEQTDDFYRQDVDVNQYRVRIKPSEIVQPGKTFVDLAESLVSEQQPTATNQPDYDMINSAAARLITKINTQFERVDSSD